MIGAIPDAPSVKYVIIAWDTSDNTVDFDASQVSVFDAAGLLSIALELAARRLPVPQYDPEPETEEYE